MSAVREQSVGPSRHSQNNFRLLLFMLSGIDAVGDGGGYHWVTAASSSPSDEGDAAVCILLRKQWHIPTHAVHTVGRRQNNKSVTYICRGHWTMHGLSALWTHNNSCRSKKELIHQGQQLSEISVPHSPSLNMVVETRDVKWVHQLGFGLLL